jgi:integral membrane protein
MKNIMDSQLGRLRVISYLEGVSLLLLVGVGVPLKHFGSDPTMVKLIGPVHGILFLLFIISALGVGVEQNWKFKETTWKVLIACIIPFGTFYIDRHILKQAAERKEHQRE